MEEFRALSQAFEKAMPYVVEQITTLGRVEPRTGTSWLRLYLDDTRTTMMPCTILGIDTKLGRGDCNMKVVLLAQKSVGDLLLLSAVGYGNDAKVIQLIPPTRMPFHGQAFYLDLGTGNGTTVNGELQARLQIAADFLDERGYMPDVADFLRLLCRPADGEARTVST